MSASLSISILCAHRRDCAACRSGDECAASVVLIDDVRRAALAHCDREISAMRAQADKPAYLVTLGIEDWEREKREMVMHENHD
jgi:hypothetical protein